MARLVVMVVMVMVVMVVVMVVTPVKSQEGEVAVLPDENTPSMDNWISRLYKDKMKHYNKNARPVLDHSQATTVVLGLSLKHIDVDDEKQEFCINAWTIMTWKDESLQWNPQDYMNIDRIHFDDDDIWLPDISMYNSAEVSQAHPFGPVPVLVDYHGQAYWFPPTRVCVKCDLHLRDWPRDTHTCLLRVGSWAHHGEQINIDTLSTNASGVMTDTLEENSRWELLAVSSTRALTSLEGHDPYVEINFSFRVQRQARTHATYITQSTLAVVVVVLATYMLPLHRLLSRLLMHLFSLGVLITCFFTLFALLPASGGPIPIVVRYYSGSIILTTLSLLATLCLLTRACCCCSSSSSSSSSSSRLAKTLGSIVTSPTRIKNLVTPQSASSTVHTPYNQLDNEVTLEDEEEEVDVEDVLRQQRRPQAAQLNRVEGRARYLPVQEEGGGEGGQVDRVTSHQFLKVINFLLFTLFAIAFVVDYVVLRNVTV